MTPPPLPSRHTHTHTHTHTAYRMPSNSPAMTELVGTLRAHAHPCTPPCPTPHKHTSRARPCNAPRAIIYTHPINQTPLSLPPGAAQNSAKITLLGLSTSRSSLGRGPHAVGSLCVYAQDICSNGIPERLRKDLTAVQTRGVLTTPTHQSLTP